MFRFEFAEQEFTVEEINALVEGIGGEIVRRFLLGEIDLVVKELYLLCKIASVELSGTEKFVINEETCKDANIVGRWGDFDEFFFGLAEEKVESAIVAVHHLQRNALDEPIMAKLGDRVEIHPAHFFAMLKKQSHGEEEGPLLTNGHAIIAYLKGKDGQRRVVYAFWGKVGSGGWRVDARSLDNRLIDNPYGWAIGHQVLSLDS